MLQLAYTLWKSIICREIVCLCLFTCLSWHYIALCWVNTQYNVTLQLEELMLNDGHLIPKLFVCNRLLIRHYRMRITVPCYSLLDHWMLSGINAFTLVHTLTHHCYGRFYTHPYSHSSLLWTVCKWQTTIYMLVYSIPSSTMSWTFTPPIVVLKSQT